MLYGLRDTAKLQLAQLRKLTRNDEEIWSGRRSVHKVWPRQMESVRYRRAVAEEPVPSNDSVFAEAREFFFNQAIRLSWRTTERAPRIRMARVTRYNDAHRFSCPR